MSQTAIRRLEHDVGELLERHETTRELKDFARWADDPVGFCRDVLKGEPWSRQVEIMRAVRDDPLVVVRSGNGCGKDWCAARLALWWCFARRGYAIVTGPTERQVKEIVFGELRSAFRSVPDLPGELFETALRVDRAGRVGILGFTSSEASRLTGFHAPRVLVIITEAQGVEDFAYEAALACATGAGDRILAVGNPLVPSGRFYSVSRSGSGWTAMQIAAAEHPNIAEGRTVIPGGPSPAFAERIAREYGEGSPIYQARVLGEFPDQGEDSLFRRSWLESAAERWRQHDAEEVKGAPVLVAVDPARFGPDETVCAVRRGSVITELVGWRRADMMESVDRVRALCDRVGVTNGTGVPTKPPGGKRAGSMHPRRRGGNPVRPKGQLVVDEVGLGAGLADRLRELGYVVHGHNGGTRAAESSRFMNLRAEAYWQLRTLLEAGDVALPPDEQLFDELIALRWRPTTDGKIRLEAKDELKGRIGRSPDRADAVTMAMTLKLRRPAPRRSTDDLIRFERMAFKARATRWSSH